MLASALVRTTRSQWLFASQRFFAHYGSCLVAMQAMQAGGVKQGSRVMVIGASGGTGTLGVQVAKAMGASHVTAVTSSGNFDFVKSVLLAQ